MRSNVERPPDVELLLQLCDVVERTLSSVHSAIAPANLGQLECLKLLSFGMGLDRLTTQKKILQYVYITMVIRPITLYREPPGQ